MTRVRENVRSVPAFYLVVLTVVVVAMIAVWCYASVRPNFSSDDAEPEILNQAWRLSIDKHLYRGLDRPPYVFGAYPPIYYAAAAFLLKLTGLSYLPAKLISFASAIATIIAVYAIRQLRRPERSENLCVALLLFLVPPFLSNSLRCHPEMLATAFSMWSLYFFLQRRAPSSLVASAILAAAALYTKQTHIALPLAASFYLALKERRSLAIYLSVFVIAVGLPTVVLQATSHGTFLLDIVRFAELDYHASTMPKLTFKLLGPIIPLLLVVCYQCISRLRHKQWGILEPYFVVTLLTGVASLGRIGSDGQYVLELIAASFVCLDLSFSAARLRRSILNFQYLLLVAGAPWFIVHNKALPALKEVRAAEPVYALLRETRGPILSEQGSFPLFTTGAIYVQLFHFGALQHRGMWNNQPVADQVRQGHFGAIVTEFPAQQRLASRGERLRFGPQLLNALRQRYRLVATSYPYYVYEPD